MVPGLTKKPGLLDLKPKSQKNLNSLIVPGSLNSPVISIEINDSDKEIPILNQEKPNNDLKKDDVFIKLSDVNLENNLLEIKTTCKCNTNYLLGDEGQLKQKAASQRKLLSVPQNPTEASDFRRFSCTQLKGLPEISVLSIEDDGKFIFVT